MNGATTRPLVGIPANGRRSSTNQGKTKPPTSESEGSVFLQEAKNEKKQPN